MKDIKQLYYKHFLQHVISSYETDLKQAKPGDCLKITGLALPELTTLIGDIRKVNSNLLVYILSDDLKGSDYISATKLIELRNSASQPLLMLIPAGSRTSAEDSYGDATFRNLNVADLQQSFFEKLVYEIPDDKKSFWSILSPFISEIKASYSSVINYLLFVDDGNYELSAWGDGLFLLGLLPDSKLFEEIHNVRWRFFFNDNQSSLLSDFSKAPVDRIRQLVIKPQTIQNSLVEFFFKENDLHNRFDIFNRIYEKYPNFNLANWPLNTEENQSGDVVVYAEIIPGNDKTKELVHAKDIGLVLNLLPNKKGRIKLSVASSPSPKDNPDIVAFQILIINREDFTERGLIRKFKLTTNRNRSRNITINVPYGSLENGNYLLAVHAVNADEIVLDGENPFKSEDEEIKWQEAKKNDDSLNRFDYRREKALLFTNETNTFYVNNVDSDNPDDDDLIGDDDTSSMKWNKVDSYLQGLIRHRIAHMKDKEEPVAEDPVKDKTDKELEAAWIEGSLNDVFRFNFGFSEAYQVQLSKKLIFLEQLILKYNDRFGQIHALVGSNPTDAKLKQAEFNAINPTISIPENLVALRTELFQLIRESAINGTGISATFDVAQNIGLLKSYITDYSNWLQELADNNIPEANALDIQNIDTVLLDVEKPDGSTCTVRLLSPLHPIRLSWQVNLYELFEDWEQRTKEYTPYERDWYRKLDKFFKGELPMNTAPIMMAESAMDEPFQYVGELTFGWGFFAKQSINTNTTFASELRQLLDYTATLMNVTREKRVDTDVSLLLVHNHIQNYVKAHPYTNKLVINLFNPGDAIVFAATMLILERNNQRLDYEIRLFTDDDLIQPGAALNDLLNPESSIADEAEAFAQSSENRLFPKLRFSRNKIQDFIKDRKKYQAHISFLINPFPVRTELVRPDELSRSFYFNGLINNSVVSQSTDGKSLVWHRYYSEKALLRSVTGFADVSSGMFINLQRMTARVMSSTQKESVPATSLRLKESDAMLLSFVHDVSDWVITFDKNMGPEFYDLPSLSDEEMPYLLDYTPSRDSTGISSFLTTRPTSEVEGVMSPCFKEFGIDISDKAFFRTLLEDVRTVSGSIVMQANSTQKKAFEVLGTTLTKRFLKKKELLDETFIIPIDLHKDLFAQADDDNKERADNLLVSFDVENREIIITVLEIKCRQSLNDTDKQNLENKILSQVTNTIEVLKEHFEIKPVYDRLDREIKTLEFKNLLEFYIKRSSRYRLLDSSITMEYLRFLSTLENGYSLRFKQLGVIFDFSQNELQQKDYLGDLVIYCLGQPSISQILSDAVTMHTLKPEEANDDITTFFEPKHKEHLISLRTGHSFENEASVSFDDSESEKSIIPVKPEEEVKPEPTPEPEPEPQPEPTPEPTPEPEPQPDPQPDPQPAPQPEPVDPDYVEPKYEMLIGDDKDSAQYGILGQVVTNKRKIAIDLNKCNTVSLFGVQGAGKSFTIGTVVEMTLRQFSKVNKLPAPMASVIFHYSDSMDYAPEFTSMIYPNDDAGQLARLKAEYGADAGSVKDVILLAPESQIDKRRSEYPNIEVHPIGFDSKELSVKDWMFLLGATGNDSTYIKELKQIMKNYRSDMSLKNIRTGVTNSTYLSNSQRNLAQQRLDFAQEYITDGTMLQQYLKPGRLIIVDLRDEFIEKDEALGLFVVMLNIFSGVTQVDGKSFNKFIVFDEAHKYMNNRDLVSSIVTTIREMRHKGVSVMIASQDPMSLPIEIIELSSMVIMHKFSSPSWVKHVQKAITALQSLTPSEMASLGIGEAFLWSVKSTDKLVTQRPIKISIRPRVTKHGGDTISAIH